MSDNTVIQIKRSGETGNVPAAANITYGELALNYADGKLYYKNDLNQIKSIYTPDVYESINVGGTLLVPISPTDILTINSANGISISACTVNDTIVIGETLTPRIDSSYAHANAAYDHANAAYNTANTLSPGFANAAYDQANTATLIAQSAFGQANTANSTAQAAFDKANTGNAIDMTDYYPTANDYGFLYESTMDRCFGSELKQISYDLSNEPVTPRGYFLTKDFGQLT